MWAIKVAIREKLYADATFKELTGATETDKRVYSGWVKRKYELSDTKPAYMTIYELPGGPTDEHKSQEFYSLDIWAISDEVRENVYKCLKDLLHYKPLSVEDVSVRRVEVDTKFDQPIEGKEDIWHKVVQLRILYAE